MPPEASTSTAPARPRGCSRTMRTQWARVSGAMLSHRTKVAPAATAASTCSGRSHSTSTIRPGHRRRAAATASAMLAWPRWLSFTSTPSERLPRWLAPPPARTAAFSRARSPGVVFLVSQTRQEGLTASTAATYRAVRLATPERWQRKLSAVRSAVTTERKLPVTVPITVPGSSRAPSRRARSSCAPPTWRRVSTANEVPARTPGARLTKTADPSASGARRTAVRSPRGSRSSSSATATALRTAGAAAPPRRRATLPRSCCRLVPEASAERLGGLRVVGPRVGAAALPPGVGGSDHCGGEVGEVAQLGLLRCDPHAVRGRVGEGGRPEVRHPGGGSLQRGGIPHDAGVSRHRLLEPLAGFGHVEPSLRRASFGGAALDAVESVRAIRERDAAGKRGGEPVGGPEALDRDRPGTALGEQTGRRRAVHAGKEGVDDAGTEDHPLEQRVGGEAVRPVHAGAGGLPRRPQARQRRCAVEIRRDAPAHVVGRRGDGQPLPARVVPGLGEGAVDRRETVAEIPETGAVEPDVGGPRAGELGRDRPAHDVARRQLVDEALPVPVTQHGPVAPEGLREERARHHRVVEGRRVELHELDVGDEL